MRMKKEGETAVRGRDSNDKGADCHASMSPGGTQAQADEQRQRGGVQD